jgi:capsular exopolysaccharide synthesis family protein
MSYVFDALQQAQRWFGKEGRAPWEPSADVPPPQYDRTPAASLPIEERDEEPDEEPDNGPWEAACLELNPTAKQRLVTLAYPENIGAEKFRLLASRLRQVQARTQLRRLLITSSVTDEGKSTLATNLAVSLAKHAGQRTLLIDGDHRQGSVSSMLNCRSAGNLHEWLTLGGPVWPFTRRHPAFPLWCLPTGKASVNPQPQVELDSLSNALSAIDKAFDWVIVDSPPVTVLADATIWLGAVDACLLVVRRGKTPKAMLRKSFASITSTKLLGIVLNDFSDSTQGYYQQYYGAVLPENFKPAGLKPFVRSPHKSPHK